ncbi:MAG: hemolysin family protein [Bryobacteraceae bacterium]
MTLLLVLLTAASSVVLALATFTQLLYLESLRLRTRELPSIRFFRDELVERIGLSVEQGAAAFSLIKHTTLLALAILYFGLFGGGQAAYWETLLRTFAAAWVTMIALAYALPQLLYRRTQGRWALPVVPLLKVLAAVARPFTGALGFFQSLIDLADENGGAAEPATPAENIEALITAGEEEGLIEKDDRELIQSVVEFGDTVVREVMTARPDMVTIAADSTLEELRQLVIREQYSRIPVYEDNIDRITGFVHVRDMFELEERERAGRAVRELVRPIRFVPETKPASDLVREMQEDGVQMVIVVDEYGNTAGLATMEDLLEVIVGEIRDEHEPDKDMQEDGQGGFIVSGNFDVSRLADLFAGFRLEHEVESSTVGGLVSEWLGRVPRPGETVEREGIRIEVLASDELRVEQVRLSRPQVVAHE